MPGFSLPQVSTVILELNLLESQFSQLQNGDARISFTGLLRRSKQMHVSGLPGTQEEGCSGGGVWGGVLLLPLEACWRWVSSSTQFGEDQGRAAPRPWPAISSLTSLAAPGSTKSGHHLSFLALAVMHTAPAQLPIQVTVSHTLAFPSGQGDCLSVLLFLTTVH